MEIAFLSDLHCFKFPWKELPKVDVVVFTGDLSFGGRYDELIPMLAHFEKLKNDQNVEVILIAGNHDFGFEKNAKIYELLCEERSLHYLNDSGITIKGVKFWGSPITPWFHNWAFNKYRGEEIKKHWDLIPEDTDVLLTHGPPHGVLDEVGNNRRVGCEELLKVVTRIKPKIHAFGHIHEGYGTLVKEGITFINSSIMNRYYQPVNEPIIKTLTIPKL